MSVLQNTVVCWWYNYYRYSYTRQILTQTLKRLSNYSNFDGICKMLDFSRSSHSSPQVACTSLLLHCLQTTNVKCTQSLSFLIVDLCLLCFTAPPRLERPQLCCLSAHASYTKGYGMVKSTESFLIVDLCKRVGCCAPLPHLDWSCVA